jgi:hypothetical protein
MTMFLRGLWKSEGRSLCDSFFYVFVTQTLVLLDSRSISYEKLPTFSCFLTILLVFPLVAGHANGVTYVNMASVVMLWLFPLLYFARDALYMSVRIPFSQNMNDVTKNCICEYVR